MTLWWLQPGWKDTTCMSCGSQIWPEGDPDWGLCLPCMTDDLERHNIGLQRHEQCEREHEAQLEREYEDYCNSMFAEEEQRRALDATRSDRTDGGGDGLR